MKSTPLLLICLLVHLVLAAQPTDNPIADHGLASGDGYPAWTDRIAWQRVINMADYPHGTNAFERFEHARDALHAAGGGVLYYPAGDYDFSDMPADGPDGRGLMLRSGVVIRGEAPAGDRWARPQPAAGFAADGELQLPTRFLFGFSERSGTGPTPQGSTPRDWNLIGLLPSENEGLADVQDVGVAWIHFVGASVFWGFELDWAGTVSYANSGAWKSALVKPAWGGRIADGRFPLDYFAGSPGTRSVVGAGKGRLVFGCVFEDSAPVNNVVMEGRSGKNFGPDGYWLQKFGARIQVYGSEVLIANNVLPKSRRSFLYRQLVGDNPSQSNNASAWTTREETILFDYNYSTAVDVNKELVNPYGNSNAIYFLPGVVVKNNYAYNHGRKGYNLSGKWMTIRNNSNPRRVLSRSVPADYGPASGESYYLTLDGYVQCKPGGPGDISDSLSRAFDLSGGPLWIHDNTFQAARSSVANDGEGILCQAHGGTHLYSWAVTANSGPEYMAGYDVNHYGSLWAWNDAAGKNIGNIKAGSLSDFAVVANVSGNVAADGSANDPDGALLACPQAAPTPPEGVTASIDDPAVRIQYSDTSSSEIGFRIERTIGDGAWQTIAYRPRQSAASSANPAEWVDYLAPRGVPLQYRVIAADCADTSSAASAPTAAVELPAIEPPAPPPPPRYEAVDYSALTAADPAWQQGFEERLGVLANAYSPWSIRAGNADTDDGKRVFTALLAEMWKVRDNPTALKNLIDTTGDSRVRSTHAGSFFKPFSVPPLTHYFHVAREIMEPGQLSTIFNRINTTTQWGYLSRPDGYMDPLYQPSLFNSENFNWMARLGGFLWSHTFEGVDLGAGKGDARSFFQTHLDNLTRALFNAGRVEWNSNNYWGHSFNPILTLYEFAPDDASRRKAKALADWMVIEAALHHLDGFQVASDVRAKSNAHLPFTGGTWPFTYLYFVDDQYHPSYSTAAVQDNIRVDYVGIVHWSNYQPPQVAIDLAQRKYPLPVEIQSAKPFYYLDHDNYRDWAGDTTKSRRFEFETIWQDDNLLLSSLATNRPDRNARIPTQSGFFTEQNLWRLGVRGTDNGALQITGNSGSTNTTTGRDPFEQIGQYRNVMMRLNKGSGRLWITVPNELTIEPAADARIFIDMGHGVYAAFTPFNHTGTNQAAPGSTHTIYSWSYPDSDLGGLVLEVGVQRDHGSYAAFKDAILQLTSLASPAVDQLAYTSTGGHELRMQFIAPDSMVLNPGQVDSSGNPLPQRIWSPAGTLPRVWQDGTEVDFQSWDSYRVVHGSDIISQSWGSGVLRAAAGDAGMEIRIHPDNGDAQFFRYHPQGTAPLPEGFETWAADLPVDQRSLHATPFADGVPNILRFALGAPAAAGPLPATRLTSVNNRLNASLQLRSAVAARFEWSPDLSQWFDANTLQGASVHITPLNPTFSDVSVSAPDHWTHGFMRIIVPADPAP